MQLRILAALILIALSCKESACDWKGGEITNYGNYCNSHVKIKVYEKDNYLKYEMRNREEDIIISNDENISVVHRWALFLDDEKNLWVFSSDIGHSCWIKGIGTKGYVKREFVGQISKDSIPAEVYATLKRFHPYSRFN